MQATGRQAVGPALKCARCRLLRMTRSGHRERRSPGRRWTCRHRCAAPLPRPRRCRCRDADADLLAARGVVSSRCARRPGFRRRPPMPLPGRWRRQPVAAVAVRPARVRCCPRPHPAAPWPACRIRPEPHGAGRGRCCRRCRRPSGGSCRCHRPGSCRRDRGPGPGRGAPGRLVTRGTRHRQRPLRRPVARYRSAVRACAWSRPVGSGRRFRLHPHRRRAADRGCAGCWWTTVGESPVETASRYPRRRGCHCR
jgi:hypothetical protein